MAASSSSNGGPMAGKWAIVTGANAGIGEAVSTQLYQQGAHVVMACRSLEWGQMALARIQLAATGTPGTLELMHLDLADGTTIQAFVKQYLAAHAELHLLVNNAGMNMGHGYDGPKTTKEGVDICFGTNFLGHFLLTKLLLPTLIASAPSRVICVGSVIHWDATGDFLPLLSGPGPNSYAESKLAMVAFTNELAAYLRDKVPRADVRAFAVDPGFTASDIWRHYPRQLDLLKDYVMLTPTQGARTTMEAATDPSLPSGSHLVPLQAPIPPALLGKWANYLGSLAGRYAFGCVVQSPSPLSLDLDFRRRLWDLSLDFWEQRGYAVDTLANINASFRRRGWSGFYVDG